MPIINVYGFRIKTDAGFVPMSNMDVVPDPANPLEPLLITGAQPAQQFREKWTAENPGLDLVLEKFSVTVPGKGIVLSPADMAAKASAKFGATAVAPAASQQDAAELPQTF